MAEHGTSEAKTEDPKQALVGSSYGKLFYIT